jgi:hypothetical protein
VISPFAAQKPKKQNKGAAREAPRNGPNGASVHADISCCACSTQPILGTRYKSVFQRGVSFCERCVRGGGEQVARARPFITMGVAASSSCSSSTPRPPASRALIEFIWHYFTQQQGGGGTGAAGAGAGGAGGGAGGGGGGGGGGGRASGGPLDAFALLRGGAAASASSGGISCVHETGLPPLYLQYSGHSVTVVGIERRPRPAAAFAAAPSSTAATSPSSSSAWWGPFWRAHDYCLLVLDPSVPPTRLETALATGGPASWGPLVRRLAAGQLLSRQGPNAQYQIVRVDRALRRAGPMRGGELGASKVPTAFEWFAT